jgi:hypothetical protein
VPSICSQDQIADWFESLAECLHWNMRKKQRQFDDADLSYYPAEGDDDSSSSGSTPQDSPLPDERKDVEIAQQIHRLSIAEHHDEHDIDDIHVADEESDDVRRVEQRVMSKPEPAAQKW